MFKFMKSKKGFTLVELMIVVVIMAILVAVAVPIFSAVTKNAQRKTCDANRREIISQVSNHILGGKDGALVVLSAEETITVTNTDGKGVVSDTAEGAKISKTVFEGLFQEVPFCPVEDGEYTVKVAANSDGSSPKVTVGCDRPGHLTATGTTNAAS